MNKYQDGRRDREKPEHWVSDAPFDPLSREVLSAEQEQFYLASQWKLMWWKFRRHPLAIVSGLFLVVIYLTSIFSEVTTPYALSKKHAKSIYAPPQAIHLFHEGSFVGPFTYPFKVTRNQETLRRIYTPDTTKVHPVRYFCQGDRYKFWGQWRWRFHLFCPFEGEIDGKRERRDGGPSAWRALRLAYQIHQRNRLGGCHMRSDLAPRSDGELPLQ